MPEPLEYRGPSRNEPVEPSEKDPPTPAIRAAVPIEFDRKLSHTTDHAAARAIELALAKENIPMFRTSDGQYANAMIDLYVREADFEAAAQIAGEIFVRRKKIRGEQPTVLRKETGSTYFDWLK